MVAEAARPAPDRVAAYLERLGWRHADEDDRTALWLPPAGTADDVQVVLPASADFRDAQDLTDQSLRVVAWVEQRTVDEVVHDVEGGGADRIAVRLPAGAFDGQVSLATAPDLLAAVRDLVTGAAVGVDAVDALVLAPRRPPRVEAYVTRAQMSTRPGSFIVDVDLPGDEPATLPLAGDSGSKPFGRRITTRLYRVTRGAAALAQRVGDGDGDVADFAQAPGRTGNATELAALSRLGAGLDRSSRYEMRFAQTPLWGAGAMPPDVLSITPAQQSVLATAATYLRERRSREDVTVDGLVVRLARAGASGAGDVVIEGVDDDSGIARRYAVNLSEDDYRDAIRAHGEGFRVVVAGDLDIRGTRKTLRRVKSFDVLARPATD